MRRVLALVRRNRAAVAIVLIATGLVGVILFTVTMSSGRGPTSRRANASNRIPPPRPLSPAAQEMVSLLERGTHTAYDATLTVSSGPDANGTVRLLRAPPLASVETVGGGAGARKARTLSLSSSSGPLACAQGESGPWTCKRRPGQEDPSLVPSSLASRLASADVAVRNDRVHGENARCFTVVQAQSTAEACLTPDGIPVRLVLGGIHIELATLDRGRPPDSAFQPPAPPED